MAFLFIFWKRLKEDYSSKLIFDSGFIFIGSFIVFSVIFFLSSKLAPDNNLFRPSQMWFWGGVLGILIALRIITSKLKLKTVETFEAAIVGSVFWMLVFYFVNFIQTSSAQSGILAAVCGGLLILFYVLNNNYKKFNWYKSGKVGFSGLMVSGLFFLFRVFFAYFAPYSFSVIGRVDVLLSAVSAFLLFFSLYNLSEA